MTLMDMFFLSVVVCFIIDVSGVMTDIRRFVANVIRRKTGVKVDYRDLTLKPIGCSLCSVWWACLIYIIVTHNVTIAYVCAAAMYSLLSSNISGLLLTLKDYAAFVEGWLQKIIKPKQ